MTAAVIERLRQPRPIALLVDAAAPAGAAGGHRLHGLAVAVVALPEVQQWVGTQSPADAAAMPALARRLRQAGARAVCILGVAGPGGRSLDWLDSEHACGWLRSAGAAGEPANSSVFANQFAAAIARGFVDADAAVLARMAATHEQTAAAHGDPDAFVHDPAALPQLSWSEAPRFALGSSAGGRPLGLYAIVENARRLEQVLAAGVTTVQLRIKAPPRPGARWDAQLRRELQQGIAACRAAGAELFVNDHWELAAELGAGGVHLGQEDLAALDDAARAAVVASGLALGVSSHSLWELCRARALAPRYIACGPVWPTATKDMPWLPQGLDNLAWWCRMAGSPVVAIGGVLSPQQVQQAARCGADGVCIVRAVGEEPKSVVPALQAALAAGRGEHALGAVPRSWPHPTLPGEP